MPMFPPQVHRSHLTPLRFLQRSASVFREKPAVVYGDRTWTYPEMAERVNRLASALLAAGVARGDRVAYLVPNIPAMLEGHFAVPLAGAILVAINTRLSAPEVAYILEHSGAKVLVVDTELAHLVEPSLANLPDLELVVSVEDVPAGVRLPGPDYEAFLASGSPDPLDWPLEDEDETIAIDYTSGTTGRPKGVMYTHRGAYLNSLGELLETRMSSDSVYLWTLPMFHCNGWCYPWAVTAIGGTHVCMRKLEPETVWRLVKSAGVTHFCAAPTVLIALVNHPDAPREPLDRPLIISTAAAPPSPTIIAQVEALGAEIIHVYGLTEVYGPYTVCEWQPQWNLLPAEERARVKARQGVGYLIADDVRVVDDEMRDVPADGETLGEVHHARQQHHEGLLSRSGGDRSAPSPAAGSTPAISRSCIPMATSSCATARRTSSSPAGRTSPPSRSSRPSAPTRPCWRRRSWVFPTRTGARSRRHSSRSNRDKH